MNAEQHDHRGGEPAGHRLCGTHRPKGRNERGRAGHEGATQAGQHDQWSATAAVGARGERQRQEDPQAGHGQDLALQAGVVGVAELVCGEGDGLGDERAEVAAEQGDHREHPDDLRGAGVEPVGWRPPGQAVPVGSVGAVAIGDPGKEVEQRAPDRNRRPEVHPFIHGEPGRSVGSLGLEWGDRQRSGPAPVRPLEQAEPVVTQRFFQQETVDRAAGVCEPVGVDGEGSANGGHGSPIPRG